VGDGDVSLYATEQGKRDAHGVSDNFDVEFVEILSREAVTEVGSCEVTEYFNTESFAD